MEGRSIKLMSMGGLTVKILKILHEVDLLALPPLVDVGLRWFTLKFNFNPEGKVLPQLL
ncbi:hypothetical protein BDA96_01G357700 [Sorghum bicolor]|uniref:Uncharacterized protein n=1 Tax=Sorghum bicolor TaxID=4558 RepID=A0A921V2C6_SORBI|nr:hypothetical protein BDA96_01G357700 [Sorghum bicolor]